MSSPFTPPTKTSGYPLGALFVLVAAAATLIAGLAPVLRTFGDEGPDLETIATAVGSGFALGSFLGGTIGLFQFRWLLGGAVGATVGGGVGIAAGLLWFAPGNLLIGIAIAFVVGSGMMVGVALLMRPRQV